MVRIEIIWFGLIQLVDTSAGMTETEFYRNVTAALALAGICITIGKNTKYKNNNNRKKIVSNCMSFFR